MAMRFKHPCESRVPGDHGAIEIRFRRYSGTPRGGRTGGRRRLSDHHSFHSHGHHSLALILSNETKSRKARPCVAHERHGRETRSASSCMDFADAGSLLPARAELCGRGASVRFLTLAKISLPGRKAVVHRASRGHSAFDRGVTCCGRLFEDWKIGDARRIIRRCRQLFNAIAAPSTDALKRSSWCRTRVTRFARSAERRWNRGWKAPTFPNMSLLNVRIRQMTGMTGDP